MSNTPIAARNIVIYLLKLSVAVTILLYLFNKVGLQTILVNMSHVKAPWLVAAFVMSLFMQLAVAVRLHALITPHSVALTRTKTFFINISSIFYGLFLPMGNVTGLAVRFYKLVRTEERYSWAVAAILADRITASVTLCLVGIIMLIGDWPISSAESFLGLVSGMVISTLLMVLMLSRTALALIARFEPVANFAWVKATVMKLKENVTAYHRLPVRNLLFIFLYSIAAHLLGVVAYYAIAQSMDLGLSFMTVGWLRCVLILITMVPITFSGLGLRELTAIVLLGSMGISQGQAVTYALLVFALTILSIALIGGVYDGVQWMRDVSTKKARQSENGVIL